MPVSCTQPHERTPWHT